MEPFCSAMIVIALQVFRIVQSSSAIKGDDEDDGLFRALDKELEEFLEEAIDDLPRKLDDLTLQNIESSGEIPPLTTTEAVTTTTTTVFPQSVTFSSEEPSSTSRIHSAEQKALNVSDASVLLQMLSSMAMTILPAQPGIREVADRIVADAVNEEVMELLSNATTTAVPHPGTSTTVSPLTSEPPTTSATLLTRNATETSSAAPSTVSFLASRIQTTVSQTVNATDSSTEKRSSCLKGAVCYGDGECGEGQCHGVSLGKCNCHACVTSMACMDDIDCGGLLKSCQNGSCRCAEALAKHGYPLYIVALTNFCSQRTCTVDSNSCFGLPCNHGICSCFS